jgi:UDP-N-acetylmuramoyl-tripeptide--D-alanyl-D-alanine ligase
VSAPAVAMRLAELARVSGGRLIGGDMAFASVSTDSRNLDRGALFVALRGPHFDGHEFIAAAIERGAVGALVERELPLSLPQVVAPDALAALSVFARAWRRQFGIPVVGVTGSNGKTTTKEMLRAILSLSGSCMVTRGNLNNHIGVPLTLLNLNAEHRSAVIEMGANHPKEIAALAAIAEPTIGIVTNAGAAHLEGFGGLEGVARGKGELFAGLPRTGVAVINADDEYANYWRQCASAQRVLTFGIDHAADFTAQALSVVNDEQGFCSYFELVTPAGSCMATLRLAGAHNLRNALGAAAAAHAAGATLDDIQAGLESMRPVGGRLELKPALKGAALIDDSYNANPSSVKAGLDALQSLGGRRWLVFGEMRELGPESKSLHAEIGNYARESGVERLLAVGEDARFAVTTFGAGAQWFADLDALIAEAQRALEAGVTVLIKGSRANRLERAANALAAPGAAKNNESH